MNLILIRLLKSMSTLNTRSRGKSRRSLERFLYVHILGFQSVQVVQLQRFLYVHILGFQSVQVVQLQQRPEHFCLWSSFDLQSPMFITLFAIGSMAFLCLMYSGVQHKILLNCLPLGDLVENKDSSTVTLNNSKSFVEVQGVHISQTVST